MLKKLKEWLSTPVVITRVELMEELFVYAATLAVMGWGLYILIDSVFNWS